MIALVRIPATPAVGCGTTELNALPEPPGSGYTAFAVHCRDVGGVRETLDWYQAVLASRPAVPLGLIAPDTEVIEPIADLDHSLAFVMNPARLNGSGLPVTALDALREAGIEGRILEEVIEEHGPEVLVHEALIRAVIARAVAGGTCGRAARDLGVHPDTLARRLQAVGLARSAAAAGTGAGVRVPDGPGGGAQRCAGRRWLDEPRAETESRGAAAAAVVRGVAADSTRIAAGSRISGGGCAGFWVFRPLSPGRMFSGTGRPRRRATVACSHQGQPAKPIPGYEMKSLAWTIAKQATFFGAVFLVGLSPIACAMRRLSSFLGNGLSFGVRSRVAALILLICSSPAVAQGAVEGTVIDWQSGAPVATALVALVTDGTPVQVVASAVTDSLGRFRVATVPRGRYRFRTERIGYEEVLTSPVDLLDSEPLVVEIALRVDAVALAPLRVVSKRQPLVGLIRLQSNGYFERLDAWGQEGLGLGYFLGPAELAEIGANRISDYVRGLRGVRVRGIGATATQIWMRNQASPYGSGCRPSVFLDGSHVQLYGDDSIDSVVSPRDVVAIEVYTGISKPAEFATMRDEPCGAIAIWTGKK